MPAAWKGSLAPRGLHWPQRPALRCPSCAAAHGCSRLFTAACGSGLVLPAARPSPGCCARAPRRPTPGGGPEASPLTTPRHGSGKKEVFPVPPFLNIYITEAFPPCSAGLGTCSPAIWLCACHRRFEQLVFFLLSLQTKYSKLLNYHSLTLMLESQKKKEK